MSEKFNMLGLGLNGVWNGLNVEGILIFWRFSILIFGEPLDSFTVGRFDLCSMLRLRISFEYLNYVSRNFRSKNWLSKL